MALTVTILGCGTSTGVPVIGCDCAVCRSDDPRNRRLRPGLWLRSETTSVLVDTPTDLRAQALRFEVPRVDAVIYTHAHADHVFGLDELRVFNFRQRAAIPCHGSPATLIALRRTFAYAFEDGQGGGGRPRLELVAVNGSFRLGDLDIVPVPLLHGELEVLGYRVGTFAYLTDCNRIPEASFGLIRGLDILVLDALRYRPHPTHFTLDEAVEAALRIGARRTVLTHLNHEVDFLNPRLELPDGIELGYDGLVLELP